MANLTKKDVAVLALASLHGGRSAIDTEDVAIAVHDLAPEAFGWRKHTEHIDLEVVRTTLRHEKESPKPRIDGSVRSGWHLTALGQAWLDANGNLIDRSKIRVADTPTAKGKRRAETRAVSAAVERVRNSSAFKTWLEGAEIGERAAAEVFRIDEYTPPRERTLKTARINDLARGHDDVAEFLKVAIPRALALRAPAVTKTERTTNDQSDD